MTALKRRVVNLGAGLAVKHGFAFKGEFFRDSGELIVLTPGNFVETGGFKYKSKEKFYDGPVPDGYLLRRGDVVVAMTEQSKGLLGSTATVPADNTFLHNQRIGLLQVTDPGLIDLRYCYHLLNSPDARNQIQATATGSKVRHTAPERIESVRIPLPDLDYQRKVAGALDSIENLIGNNRRRIGVVEEMARLIYREWFVHHRFPGHEAADFVDSDLGSIPEDWVALRLEDITEVAKGLSYKGAHLVDEGAPMANLKCLAPSGGFRRDGVKLYDGQFRDRHSVEAGDIVVANTDLTQAGNVIGSAARLPRAIFESGGLFSHHLFRVRVLDGAPVGPNYLLLALRDARFRTWARASASGTTVLGLRREDAQRYPVLVPEEELLGEFEEVVRPLLGLAEVLEDQSETIAAVRDLLLPRLISGELDVSDLELDIEPVG